MIGESSPERSMGGYRSYTVGAKVRCRCIMLQLFQLCPWLCCAYFLKKIFLTQVFQLVRDFLALSIKNVVGISEIEFLFVKGNCATVIDVKTGAWPSIYFFIQLDWTCLNCFCFLFLLNLLRILLCCAQGVELHALHVSGPCFDS